MKYKSKATSVENVRKFFSNTSDDSISLNDAFAAWGRNLDKPEDNKAWLSNLLTHLKYHNLIKPVYSFKSGYRKLDKLQLTLDGKRALGRLEDDSSNAPKNVASNGKTNPLSSTDVMKIVAQLGKDNPDYEITFDVKLKGK